MLIGALAMVTHALMLPLAPAGIFVPAMVIAFGNGVGQPNGIAGAISVDPRRAGAASGIVGFLQMGAGAIGTHVVGHTLGSTLLPLGLTITLLAVMSALAFTVAIRLRPGLPGAGSR